MNRAIVLLLLPAAAHAGLYYSGETIADLPSRHAGFLLDHRALLRVARAEPATALRARYAAEAARLAAKATLSADEAADLGALHLRLGDAGRALAVLRPAQRAHPEYFRLAANLGTAWHTAGDLAQAAAALELAVKLAPDRLVKAEELHLKLVRLRAREKESDLDDLFGVDYSDPASVKKLPAAAVAQVQRLSLSLPADPRLLWQLGELAGAHGDHATRAAILDGCVTEFEMRRPRLLASRRAARALAEARPTKADHDEHSWLFKPRSSRPLVSKSGLDALPPIDPTGVTALAWEVIAETTVDRRGRPTFHRYLKDLDGKRVTLVGHMQPLGEGTDYSAFLLVENPVGCWYCESPELSTIVLIELPAGRAGRFTRAEIKVTGKLVLNARDPENFLYTLEGSKIDGGGGE